MPRYVLLLSLLDAVDRLERAQEDLTAGDGRRRITALAKGVDRQLFESLGIRGEDDGVAGFVGDI